MSDKEIDNMVIVKYENHLITKEHFRNQWKKKCKMEEIKSSQIRQDQEAYMRSYIDRIIIPNSIEQVSNEERRHVTKRTLKNMENGDQEVLIDNALAILESMNTHTWKNSKERCIQKKVVNFLTTLHLTRLVET